MSGSNMDASTPAGEGSLETRQDIRGPAETVEFWLGQIDLSTNEEKPWRDDARDAVDAYKAEEDDLQFSTLSGPPAEFPILYSNIQTLAPAVYNSEPIPDVRRRYGDSQDQAGAEISEILERALSYCMDAYDFDGVMKAAVLDRLLPGRGVARVRWQPDRGRVAAETVGWDDFRCQPERSWDRVQWVAFRHAMTRAALNRLNPDLGPLVSMTTSAAGSRDKPDTLPDVFKRSDVWEIWDREAKQVIFVAEGYRAAPLLMSEDPYGLEGFFPIPKPMVDVTQPDNLTPICPYKLYKSQADELETATKRLQGLVKALKWRGLSAGNIPELADLSDLEDGEMQPIQSVDAMAVMSQPGGLDAAFWLMPIERLINVIQELSAYRESVKATIYEITGISDLMRGDTQASETATAQGIKQTWGGLRLQDRRGDVARFARDLIRIMGELLADRVPPAQLAAMTGITPSPQSIQIMQSDQMRAYRVDIETNSTIQNDNQEAQRNIAGFIGGVGQLVTAMGPIVQVMPQFIPVILATLKAGARTFKLGRELEGMIDQLGQQMQASPPAAAPDPALLEQAKAQGVLATQQAKTQGQIATVQAKAQADLAKTQMETASRERVASWQIQADMEKQRVQQEHERQQAFAQAIAQADGSNVPGLGDSMASTANALGRLDAGMSAMAEAHHALNTKLDGVHAVLGQMEQRRSMPRHVQRDAQGRIVAIGNMTVVRGPDGRPHSIVTQG